MAGIKFELEMIAISKVIDGFNRHERSGSPKLRIQSDIEVLSVRDGQRYQTMPPRGNARIFQFSALLCSRDSAFHGNCDGYP
jgi:hypothetical protein